MKTGSEQKKQKKQLLYLFTALSRLKRKQPKRIKKIPLQAFDFFALTFLYKTVSHCSSVFPLKHTEKRSSCPPIRTSSLSPLKINCRALLQFVYFSYYKKLSYATSLMYNISYAFWV